MINSFFAKLAVDMDIVVQSSGYTQFMVNAA